MPALFHVIDSTTIRCLKTSNTLFKQFRLLSTIPTPPFPTTAISISSTSDPKAANKSTAVTAEANNLSIEITPAHVVSEVPEFMLTDRRAHIYRPAKTAMQSGKQGQNQWFLNFDTCEKWKNPLIGYTSRFFLSFLVTFSGDPVQSLRLSFDTQEEAETFAIKQGSLALFSLLFLR